MSQQITITLPDTRTATYILVAVVILILLLLVYRHWWLIPPHHGDDAAKLYQNFPHAVRMEELQSHEEIFEFYYRKSCGACVMFDPQFRKFLTTAPSWFKFVPHNCEVGANRDAACSNVQYLPTITYRRNRKDKTAQQYSFERHGYTSEAVERWVLRMHNGDIENDEEQNCEEEDDDFHTSTVTNAADNDDSSDTTTNTNVTESSNNVTPPSDGYNNVFTVA